MNVKGKHQRCSKKRKDQRPQTKGPFVVNENVGCRFHIVFAHTLEFNISLAGKECGSLETRDVWYELMENECFILVFQINVFSTWLETLTGFKSCNRDSMDDISLSNKVLLNLGFQLFLSQNQPPSVLVDCYI